MIVEVRSTFGRIVHRSPRVLAFETICGLSLGANNLKFVSSSSLASRSAPDMSHAGIATSADVLDSVVTRCPIRRFVSDDCQTPWQWVNGLPSRHPRNTPATKVTAAPDG